MALGDVEVERLVQAIVATGAAGVPPPATELVAGDLMAGWVDALRRFVTPSASEAQAARPGVLGGEVGLDDLRWQAPTEARGTRFQLGLTLDALDLGSLSQRLGWPAFTGTVGGRIPSARYENNVLTLDGGLAMQVFGGTVSLSELVMERPFGVAPTLSADIAIEDIDMEPMTAAFGFGSITGRLDGRIAGLRMVDWSPVAFDARLVTDEAWKGRRRISQRAVEDISKVGGAGLVAGLQTQVLKLFDDFGYARIGLACRQLGSAVEAWNEAGEPVIDEVGELVCTRPLPSMPLYLWGDEGNARYLSSYFDVYPGIWRHGDWVRIHPDGSCVIYGRSDATINRHGLRMGTSEIYAAVEALPEVLDAMVIDLEYLGRPSRMILFVVLTALCGFLFT